MSRTLDDIEELIPPLAIALGALYFVWWFTTVAEREIINPVTDVPGIVYQDLKDTGAGVEDWIGDRVDWLWDTSTAPFRAAQDAAQRVNQYNPFWGWFR